ncbi:encapsulin [Candidatus Acetothermia bacterium]|nr:encapsulin [Candidatus Acetothermia bacterium]
MPFGRENVPQWNQEVWDRIDKAVHDETQRTKIAAKFLPLFGPLTDPSTKTVPSDIIDPKTMTVDEGEVTPLVEIWVEFALTKQQVEAEQQSSTAVILATRAANLLSQGEDLLIFQGKKATGNPLFKSQTIRLRGQAPDPGLVDAAASNHTVNVNPVNQGPPKQYGENTFRSVSEGYSFLEGEGQYGPFALALHFVEYADTYAPLANTLIAPADRIKPLVPAGFYGTGTLPDSTGVLLSLGGNTVDLVVGIDATTAFTQVDGEGLYRFRVFERFALRVKDKTGFVELAFQ